MIALDNCPGVRPIGIGESLHRIVGKAICSATRLDLAVLCGTDQLCGGIRSGIEGAVHAITDLFEEHRTSGWGVLLVDASNTFNSLNRAALLWNVRILWPRCSRFFFNTYRGSSPLVVRGSDVFLFSQEGRYLAPSMFKLSPVINSLVAFLVMFRQGPPLFKIWSIVGYLMFVIYPRWLYLSHRPPMWH